MDQDRKNRYKSMRPKSGGAIQLFSTEFDDENMKIDKVPKNFLKFHPSVSDKNKSTQSTAVPRIASSTSSSGNSIPIKEWINLKSLINIRDRHSAESSSVRQLYGTVLSNEENFVKGIDDFLKEQELLNLRKKEILYKKWQERVYIPVRKEVEKVMEGRFDQLDQQKRIEYAKYLRHVDRKGVVFLDAVSPDEYDPWTIYNPSSSYSLKARTPRLNDPLLKSERQRLGEERLILRCQTGEVLPDRVLLSRRLPPHPLVPLGRTGNNNSSWLSLSLLNMDGPDRNKSRQRMAGKSNESEIDLVAWNSHACDPSVVDVELRIQKKRHFELPSTMPSHVLMQDPISEGASVRFADSPFLSTA